MRLFASLASQVAIALLDQRLRITYRALQNKETKEYYKLESGDSSSEDEQEDESPAEKKSTAANNAAPKKTAWYPTTSKNWYKWFTPWSALLEAIQEFSPLLFS